MPIKLADEHTAPKLDVAVVTKPDGDDVFNTLLLKKHTMDSTVM